MVFNPLWTTLKSVSVSIFYRTCPHPPLQVVESSRKNYDNISQFQLSHKHLFRYFVWCLPTTKVVWPINSHTGWWRVCIIYNRGETVWWHEAVLFPNVQEKLENGRLHFVWTNRAYLVSHLCNPTRRTDVIDKHNHKHNIRDRVVTTWSYIFYKRPISVCNLSKQQSWYPNAIYVYKYMHSTLNSAKR